MNTNQQSVAEFMRGIPSQAECMPSVPTMPPLAVRILRAKLLFEEVMETIRWGFGLNVIVTIPLNYSRVKADSFPIDGHSAEFEETTDLQPSLIEIADGLADTEVVLLGAALACGIDHQPVFELVAENNLLKLERGTINAAGKLIKPHDHPRPDVASELRKQGSRLE
jgi:predicted HAD superfamily Cof-like phosphohydrolase